jgi:hypothetical protein
MKLGEKTTLVCGGWWKVPQSLPPAREECNKYDLTAAPCFSDWPIIMISPSGWLLVVSRLFAGTVLVLWVRVEKKVNNRNLDVSWNIFAGSHNDHHGWRCSNYVSMASASQWVWPLLWKLKNYSLYWTSHWFLVFAMVNLCFAYGPTLLTWLYSNQQVFWHATHVWRH